MKLRNLIKNSIIDNVDVESDYGEYLKLENDKVPLIKKEDLPFEFSDESFETIIDFVEKTRNLDYEWIIFFDYFTGEILKCVKGERKNVNVEFDVNEFKGFHVASIHNHPENVYSPPSGKNLEFLQGILKIMNSFRALGISGF